MAHRPVTDQQIEKALTKVARLIECYGDAYWPIFERLETELEMRQSRAARLKQRLHPQQRLKPQAKGKALRFMLGKARDKSELKILKDITPHA